MLYTRVGMRGWRHLTTSLPRLSVQILRQDQNIGAVTTDGHYTGDHGVATLVYEFKNWSTDNPAIPEVELVGYFAHSVAQGVSKKLGRVPGIGVTIVGMD